jgi:hypothetical protein
MLSPIDDPEHWRKRAEETRACRYVKEEKSKEMMLRMTDDYERLAKAKRTPRN